MFERSVDGIHGFRASDSPYKFGIKGAVIRHLGWKDSPFDITAGRARATDAGAGGCGIGRQFVDVR